MTQPRIKNSNQGVILELNEGISSEENAILDNLEAKMVFEGLQGLEEEKEQGL